MTRLKRAAITILITIPIVILRSVWLYAALLVAVLLGLITDESILWHTFN